MTSIDEQAYWTRRNEQLAQAIQTDREISQTFDGQLHRLQSEYSAIPDTDTVRRAAKLAEIDALCKANEADELTRFLAEWTLDVTTSRRADWNARTMRGDFSRGGKPWMPYVAAAEREQGWTLQALKQAVAHYHL